MYTRNFKSTAFYCVTGMKMIGTVTISKANGTCIRRELTYSSRFHHFYGNRGKTQRKMVTDEESE